VQAPRAPHGKGKRGGGDQQQSTDLSLPLNDVRSGCALSGRLRLHPRDVRHFALLNVMDLY